VSGRFVLERSFEFTYPVEAPSTCRDEFIPISSTGIRVKKHCFKRSVKDKNCENSWARASFHHFLRTVNTLKHFYLSITTIIVSVVMGQLVDSTLLELYSAIVNHSRRNKARFITVTHEIRHYWRKCLKRLRQNVLAQKAPSGTFLRAASWQAPARATTTSWHRWWLPRWAIGGSPCLKKSCCW